MNWQCLLRAPVGVCGLAVRSLHCVVHRWGPWYRTRPWDIPERHLSVWSLSGPFYYASPLRQHLFILTGTLWKCRIASWRRCYRHWMTRPCLCFNPSLSVRGVRDNAWLVCVCPSAIQLCRGQCKHFCLCRWATAVRRQPFSSHSLFLSVLAWWFLDLIRTSSWQHALLYSDFLNKRRCSFSLFEIMLNSNPWFAILGR